MTTNLDEIGREVPPGLLPAFEGAARLRLVVAEVNAARRAVEALAGVPGVAFLDVQQAVRDLRAIAQEVSHSRYWTTCPRCQGETQPECHRCGGNGFVPFRDRRRLDADERRYLETNK